MACDLQRTTDTGQRTTDNGLPTGSRRPARWRNGWTRTSGGRTTARCLERLAAHHPLRPLGELIDRQDGLIPGDHVRPSRGETKGAGLPYEYYQTREFMPTGYNYAAIERCDERAYRRLRRTAVQRHDILVSCAGVGGAGEGGSAWSRTSPGHPAPAMC